MSETDRKPYLETFIVGESNRHAYACVICAINGLSEFSNPLIITGPGSVGKSHLLAGAANSAGEDKVFYISAADLVNEIICEIRKSEKLIPVSTIRNIFVNRFNAYDVIIIDNIHVLLGKPATQDEIFKITQALVARGKRVFIGSDTPIEKYEVLFGKSAEFFQNMSICYIEKPDSKLKTKFLNVYAGNIGISFEKEAAEWIIDNSDTVTSVREKTNRIVLLTGKKNGINLSDVKILEER